MGALSSGPLGGARGMSVGEFADAIDIAPANVAVLKNGRATAVHLSALDPRPSPLDAICRVLECRCGDLLHHENREDEPEQSG